MSGPPIRSVLAVHTIDTKCTEEHGEAVRNKRNSRVPRTDSYSPSKHDIRSVDINLQPSELLFTVQKEHARPATSTFRSSTQRKMNREQAVLSTVTPSLFTLKVNITK